VDDTDEGFRIPPPATMVQRRATPATVSLVECLCMVFEHHWYVDQFLACLFCHVSRFFRVASVAFIETLILTLVYLYVPVLDFEEPFKTHAWYTKTVWQFGRFLFPFICGIFLQVTLESSVDLPDHYANSSTSNGKSHSSDSLLKTRHLCA